MLLATSSDQPLGHFILSLSRTLGETVPNHPKRDPVAAFSLGNSVLVAGQEGSGLLLTWLLVLGQVHVLKSGCLH